MLCISTSVGYIIAYYSRFFFERELGNESNIQWILFVWFLPGIWRVTITFLKMKTIQPLSQLLHLHFEGRAFAQIPSIKGCLGILNTFSRSTSANDICASDFLGLKSLSINPHGDLQPVVENIHVKSLFPLQVFLQGASQLSEAFVFTKLLIIC